MSPCYLPFFDRNLSYTVVKCDLYVFLSAYRLVGLVVKASASRAEDPGFKCRLRKVFFRGRVIPVTSKLALQWLPCQAPGVIGSVLGLVGVSIL